MLKVMVKTIVNHDSNRLRPLLVSIAMICLGACGGGGYNGGSNPPEPPPELPLAADEVRTIEGVYKGSIEGTLRVFRGLRYAAPPTGNLRFRAPAAPASFASTTDATTFESNCFQPAGSGTAGDEDCLFLNIWSHDDDSVRPVLVFMHGGNSNNIGGDLATTDGSMLAENGDIIVATMNRRIGVFGALALDELIQESPRNTAGNYAVQDVQAALRWLQDNVDQFNGDPNRIVLAGESAGGKLLCYVLSSPDTAGLISAAIMQSAGCGVRIRLNDSIPIVTPFDNALNLHRPVLAAAGCDLAADPLQCLRNLPAEDVLAAAQSVDLSDGVRGTFGMIVDGVVVTSDPHTSLINEIAGPIPVIVGSNDNEGGGGISSTPADDAAYRTLLSNIFGAPRDDQIYAVYPTADFASVADAWRIFWGDWRFNCVAEELARSASGNTPSYMYNFSRGFSTGSRAGLGAIHAIDVPFLFETYDLFGHTPDVDDAAVTDAMQNAWTGLARDPSAAPPYLPSGSSSWPAFDINNVQIVNFNSPMTIDTVHREGRCALLREIISL
jgi:para-nitrobenzyl esterase